MNLADFFSKSKSKELATENDIDVGAIAGVHKKKYDLDSIVQSFSQLDPQNMGSWPLVVRVTALIAVFVVAIVIVWLLLISSVRDQITNGGVDEQRLLTEYSDKNDKVKNLSQYQAQYIKMESEFGHLVEQLPKVNEISGLVEDISFTGTGSGVQLSDIKVGTEVPQQLFIELPITIQAKGDFHGFGAFMTGIAALPRIVTVHDFSITPEGKDTSKSQIPVLNMKLSAKTYRYNDEVKTPDTKQPPVANQPPAAGVK